ncbi:MAG: 2-oxoacid:acceptor oxidoreductase family protein [Arenicellales bacterium]|nr:2-oxoacid:acceptor oxidoreductase family protein [Arenicellales bacterium]
MAKEIEIRLSGSGGQGLILAARILSAALTASGLNVAHSQSYEPTSRGGLSRSDLVISDGEVDYPLVTELDYLVIMDQVAAHASTGLLKADAVLVIDSSRVTSPPKGTFKTHAFPLTEIARKLGSGRVANIVALGVLNGISELCTSESFELAVDDQAPRGFRELNLKAFKEGYTLATTGKAVSAPVVSLA